MNLVNFAKKRNIYNQKVSDMRNILDESIERAIVTLIEGIFKVKNGTISDKVLSIVDNYDNYLHRASIMASREAEGRGNEMLIVDNRYEQYTRLLHNGGRKSCNICFHIAIQERESLDNKDQKRMI